MTRPWTRERIAAVLKEITRLMAYHPGDAPWSCIKCYHNRPCVERDILVAARHHLASRMGAL